jgi:hypothetical protein
MFAQVDSNSTTHLTRLVQLPVAKSLLADSVLRELEQELLEVIWWKDFSKLVFLSSRSHTGRNRPRICNNPVTLI